MHSNFIFMLLQVAFSLIILRRFPFLLWILSILAIHFALGHSHLLLLISSQGQAIAVLD